MKKFDFRSQFRAAGDQPQAINSLVKGIKAGIKERVLLGVTGSGKTFTMASAIASLNWPTLILCHNKTLAAQLYQEFRDFFPNNAVSYFVSYYDYYQPEAYLPQTDTYIEKETEINEEIDKLRLLATANLLTRPDSIIVASVSCIYNIGSPAEYGNFVIELVCNMTMNRGDLLRRLVELQYERNDFSFHRSSFRVRGDTIDLIPAYEDEVLRIIISQDDRVTALEKRDSLTGKKIGDLQSVYIYPAKHYMTNPSEYKDVFKLIRADLAKRVKYFKDKQKFIEAQRIKERVEYDLEMISQLGYVNGIENYSRYFDGRNTGDPPYTLLEYFREAAKRFLGDCNKWLLFVDESHMTIPQVRGMYHGDRSRKQTLVDFGFRLPAALDNRPLKFDEFLRLAPSTVYVSATPDEWEISRARECLESTTTPNLTPIVEQLVRPTGLVDPEVTIRSTKDEVEDVIKEINKRAKAGERTLVTTLTKQMAEDLSNYLEQLGVKVHYLHSDVETLDRTDILAKLRSGDFDVIVGVNLLREGLDLPEVTLVAILDADKEGFLRSKTSLIQTMGRAARHIRGEVIMYADTLTKSMSAAITEVKRRRQIQLSYNLKYHITARSIVKPIRMALVQRLPDDKKGSNNYLSENINIDSLTPMDKERILKDAYKQMRQAGRNLDFEKAAKLRDFIRQNGGPLVK